MLLIAATVDALVDVAAVVVTGAAAKVDVAALAVPVQHVAIMCLGELYAKQPYWVSKWQQLTQPLFSCINCSR